MQVANQGFFDNGIKPALVQTKNLGFSDGTISQIPNF